MHSVYFDAGKLASLSVHCSEAGSQFGCEHDLLALRELIDLIIEGKKDEGL